MHTLGGDIAVLQPDIAKWREPALTMLRGTVLGAQDFRLYMRADIDRDSQQPRH
jgi:hypothetical protein